MELKKNIIRNISSNDMKYLMNISNTCGKYLFIKQRDFVESVKLFAKQYLNYSSIINSTEFKNEISDYKEIIPVMKILLSYLNII